MKKLLLIALVLCTMSCNIMEYGVPKYTIGMNEEEFMQLNRHTQKVMANDKSLAIYRTRNGTQSIYAFFVFDKGKLVRFEEGDQSDDYKFMGL